jgi:predicted DNA repair protein MutK
MAGSSLFALIDDIASLLDDVSVMTKIATKKTAGVLGDDLALNAQQVSGINADRELPVVWAVAKGSLVNKAILVPAALAISALETWLHGRGYNIPLVTPLMMLGGAFLCFEGVEKLAHKFLHDKSEDRQHHAELIEAVKDENVDMVAFEKDKVRGAIRTDFILSAEIIVISLGTLAGRTFVEQLLTLVAIALIMTIGVYGLVGGIVKLDDLGLALNRDQSDGSWPKVKRNIGTGILRGAPYLMKFLSIAGTAAMFLVGGGILVHGLPPLHHLIEPYAQGTAGTLVSMLFDAVVGILIGIGVLLAVKLVSRLRKPKTLPTG